MKINVLFAVPPLSTKFESWHDGFTSAMGLLGQEHDVCWLNVHPLAPGWEAARKEMFDCDLLLIKSNFGWIPDVAYAEEAATRSISPRVVLMISGSFPPGQGDLERFDLLFYETEWMAPLLDAHPLAVRAFGIDTDVMNTSGAPSVRPVDWLMVGRPSSFKHPEELARRSGHRLLVGETAGALEAVEALKTAGVEVRDFVPYAELADVYRQSKTLVVAADLHGGGERAVWEARACGCRVELVSDNPKLEEMATSAIWSHHDYARALREGMEAVMESPTQLRTAETADFRRWVRVRRRREMTGRVVRFVRRAPGRARRVVGRVLGALRL